MKSVIICDMEGLITNMNEGAEKVFGYPSDELVGIKRVSIFSPGGIVLQNVLGWLKDANESGEHNTKTNFIRKDGSKFSAKIKITPNFGDGKNNPQTGYCGITEVIDEDVNIKINWGTKIIKGVVITRVGFASTAIASRIPNSETVLDAVMTASYAITGRFKEKYDDVDERRARRVLTEWHLSEYADRAFGTLSDGERKRTQIARAVMPDPELLLLDEPSLGLAPLIIEQIFQTIKSLVKKMDLTVLLVEQNAMGALKIADEGVVLNLGSVVAADSAQNLLNDPAVRSAYLGF